jgi:leucyl aminopeptidase (aminopeptidase T)
MDARHSLPSAALVVSEGTRLRVVGEAPHRELMRAIARGAYERGAALVRLEYRDAVLKAECDAFADEGWAYPRLLGDECPNAMEGADQDRLTRILRAWGKAVERLLAAQMASRFPWCIVPAATEAWARSVLGPSAGFNVSLVHEDLMIGSPSMDVTGVDASGREIPLMRRGDFAI